MKRRFDTETTPRSAGRGADVRSAALRGTVGRRQHLVAVAWWVGILIVGYALAMSTYHRTSD